VTNDAKKKIRLSNCTRPPVFGGSGTPHRLFAVAPLPEFRHQEPTGTRGRTRPPPGRGSGPLAENCGNSRMSNLGRNPTGKPRNRFWTSGTGRVRQAQSAPKLISVRAPDWRLGSPRCERISAKSAERITWHMRRSAHCAALGRGTIGIFNVKSSAACLAQASSPSWRALRAGLTPPPITPLELGKTFQPALRPQRPTFNTNSRPVQNEPFTSATTAGTLPMYRKPPVLPISGAQTRKGCAEAHPILCIHLLTESPHSPDR